MSPCQFCRPGCAGLDACQHEALRAIIQARITAGTLGLGVDEIRERDEARHGDTVTRWAQIEERREW